MTGLNSKIVTVYEGSENFVETSRLVGLLETVGCTPSPAETDAIEFSRFWTEECWGKAVSAASTADVIVVSLSGRAELPMPVQRWVESWPRYEVMNHPSLVLVLGNTGANLSKQDTLISYFRRIAESHGLDFFCQLGNHCKTGSQTATFETN